MFVVRDVFGQTEKSLRIFFGSSLLARNYGQIEVSRFLFPVLAVLVRGYRFLFRFRGSGSVLFKVPAWFSVA